MATAVSQTLYTDTFAEMLASWAASISAIVLPPSQTTAGSRRPAALAMATRPRCHTTDYPALQSQAEPRNRSLPPR